MKNILFLVVFDKILAKFVDKEDTKVAEKLNI